MNILQEDLGRKGRFYTDDGLAEIVYSRIDGHTIIIEHTEVDKSLKGQGIGYSLVDAVVNWARAEELKILPLCPFAKAVFQRKPAYHDVLFHG